MEVSKIVINGIEINTLDKPIGLEATKLGLDRDFQYSCIDTTIEAELKFYCASGKEQLDAEYESKGIEGTGYVEITDTCGTNSQIYTFNLDFKKYNNNGNYTTVGLIDVNSLWKQDLNKEVKVSDFSGAMADFYVRNLQNTYDYESINVYAKIDNDSFNSEHSKDSFPTYQSSPPTIPPSSAPPLPSSYYFPLSHFIMPRVNETVNELEDSDKLVMDYFVIGNSTTKDMTFIDVSNVSTPNTPSTYSEIEPTPLFTNVNEGGDFTLSTDNTQITIDLSRNIDIDTRLEQISEIIVVGKKYDLPRIIYKNELYATPQTLISTSPTAYIYNFSKSFNEVLEVRDNESVWIYYEVVYNRYISGTPTYSAGTNLWTYALPNHIYFEAMSYGIANEISGQFVIKKNTAVSLTTSADIEPYHTKTKAYQGAGFLNSVFGIDYNICNTVCFEDLWFTRGDYLRGKINVADFIIKPSDFFRELEKVVCCGLGYFYDTNPIGEKRLMSVYDFYSDNLVPIDYQFDYNDLIDGKIEIAPFLSPYYKEVQIGYGNFKDSPKDLCKQNNYSINNISDNTYSKISDIIASQYLITRALRFGTEDKELEYDKNIFLFSGTQYSGYNVTLSQATGILADTVFTTPIDSQGINRRYATAFNLFRHLYKWGFSLFADKDKLSVTKYEGNSIYDYAIQYLLGSPTPPYTGLNICKLPVSESVKVDRTIDNINDLIEKNIYVPSQITFKTANLSNLQLLAMRKYQYDLFPVTDGVKTFYGNLISANLEDDVTEIKLLRRFKDRP